MFHLCAFPFFFFPLSHFIPLVSELRHRLASASFLDPSAVREERGEETHGCKAKMKFLCKENSQPVLTVKVGMPLDSKSKYVGNIFVH